MEGNQKRRTMKKTKRKKPISILDYLSPEHARRYMAGMKRLEREFAEEDKKTAPKRTRRIA
jgi:hypothetical protein